MKHKLVALVLLLSATIVMAGAPANNGVAPALVASQVIDSEATGTWESVATLVVTQTDSCISAYTVQFTAALDPGDVLYVGFHIMGGVAAAATTVDTIAWPQEAKLGTSITRSCTLMDTSLTATDDLDSVFITAAIQGSTPSEYVTLTNIQASASVIPKNL